jgi:hypothetical protein
MAVFTGNIEVGTRVHCILSFAGEGVVFAVHGDQDASSVKSFGGVGFSGGSAWVDVVFESGSISLKLPEGLLRSSVQWSILDGLASQQEIDSLVQMAEKMEADKKAAEQKAKEAFEGEVKRLAGAEEYAHLKQEGDKAGGGLAAANIRKELKAAFPGVKFSVRKRSYSSLAVAWVDGPTVKEVEAITARYQAGSFCGMEDIYKRNASPWNAVFGEADYIFCSREYSSEFLGKTIEQVFCEYPADLEESGVDMPTAEQYRSGGLYYIQIHSLGLNLQQLIGQAACARGA